MASGAQHEHASTLFILRAQPLLLFIMGAMVVAVWLGYVDWLYALMISVAAFGYLFGLYVGRRVTPDLDIDEIITRQTRRYMQRHLILGWFWRIYWWPYAIAHPHRGMAHTPFIGTLGRWVYLFFIPIAILFVMTWRYSLFFWLHALFWVWVYAGQASQDLLHIWMDR